MYKTLKEAKEKNPDCLAFTWKKADNGEQMWFPRERYSMSSVEFSGGDVYSGVPSPIDGHVFTGKRDWLEHQKKHNVVCKA